MNVLLIVLVGLIIAFGLYKTISRSKQGSACCGGHEENIKRVGPSDRNKSHYPYEAKADIMGMTCDNCAARVENALNKLDGIWASVSINSKKAKILSKEKTTKQLFEEFYNKPFDMISDDDIGDGNEINWGADVGGEVF